MERIGKKEAAIISNFQSRILDFEKVQFIKKINRDVQKRLSWN